MKTSDFDFELPENLIAQKPILKRDSSKLLVLDKITGQLEHKQFVDIINYLNKDDVLVINDTKVIPARITGIKEETKAVIELLLLKNKKNNVWECLVKPFKRVKTNTVIDFGNGLLKAKCVEKKKEGLATFSLMYEGVLYEILDELGEMPLPPYIRTKLEDKNRYQTVYAKNIGSAAAPTAGLHFSEQLMETIKNKGVNIVPITLHVGLGTFRPVQVDKINEHKMHSEFYSLSKEAANKLNDAKKNNKKIIGVGTTTARVLETVLINNNRFKECKGFTEIFIYPGFEFKAIDMLITNFHLPKSTLVMLVSALAGKEQLLNAYKEAINSNYMFFSFGDSMLIK